MDAKLAEYNRAVEEINRRGEKLLEVKGLYESLKADLEKAVRAEKHWSDAWIELHKKYVVLGNETQNLEEALEEIVNQGGFEGFCDCLKIANTALNLNSLATNTEDRRLVKRRKS